MTTSRLYYHDAYLREFEATVLEVQDTPDGPAVRLDRTAFYPTSGGQPHDTGSLNHVPVVDVWEDDHSEIWHRLAAPLSVGPVTGRVDSERRFDHMQQHTGQHLLSAACIHLLDAATVSFHLGSEAGTIDLALSTLSWDTAHVIEDAVNRVIWENRPVTIHIVDQAQISAFPLRKPPKVEGPVRVIWVKDYDASACGGTHVANTGEIGLLKIAGLEKYKGGVRVTFLCGARALRAYQRVLRVNQEMSALLSVGPDELPVALARVQEELKTVRRTLAGMQNELALLEADRLWTEAAETDVGRWVVASYTDKSFAEIKAMAARLRERPRTLALLATVEPAGLRLICGRSDDLPAVDAAAVLQRVLVTLGGRGGGSSALAQGGSPAHPSEVVRQVLMAAVPIST